MFEDEIWRDVVGYEGLYQVSNLGRVKSFHRGKEKVLNPTVNSAGYMHLTLCVAGKHTSRTVHSLVAEVFVPNPDGKPEINHIDGDKLNNCAWNLEWTTCRENLRHASKMGLLNIHKGADNPCAKLPMETARYIRRVYVSHHREFGGRALAKQFKVTPQTIYDIVRGKTYKENP